ncbi:hypothetical protein FZI36_13250 [Cronobacter sakazakii]|uniref:hypothetical protein n=1 Tax=Enterobacteriaceae TaxID=543 RepID=UPI00107DC5FA|nr:MULTISPECIES: hypothetical protein [Enterobacteriaceae]EAA9542348.1 hypothetical protein [Salmonella enterica subsp. enterica]EAN6818337.1 hypothetical protein [Salmonella enterica]EME1699669.1 hypothetical protein [Cronobacter sakazakii]MCP5870751.1 hypothetical protein [Klebsiella pneumoniae]EAR7556291.1 hypothetical protein [Salmonella enterica]
MLTVVYCIWSIIGLGIIMLALWAAISKSTEAKINKDDDIRSMKKRLFKIEERLKLDSDDDYDY